MFNIGLSKIVGITFIVIITRLARVKEEMGDKDGAEDLREEAGESFPNSLLALSSKNDTQRKEKKSSLG